MRKDRHYPLRLPAEDAKAVDAVCQESHVSFNRIVSLCVKQGLPAVRKSLSGTGRITNVDPLPREVLKRLYDEREEDDKAIRRMIAAQPRRPE